MKRKAPPKKRGRGPGKKNLPAPATIDEIVETLPPLPDDAEKEWIREQAKYVYTTSLAKLTLRDIAAHPWFRGHVAIRTLERWCEGESWVELRRQTAEQWRQRLTEETGRELVEARRGWLQNLRIISNHVFQQLLPDKDGKFQLQAQSYESMVQAFVKAVGLMDAMTQNTLDIVMPDVLPASQASEQSATALQPDLTIEEARIAGRAIMEARLAEQRRLTAAHYKSEKKGTSGGA